MKTNGLSCSHSRSTAKAFKASAAELADAHGCHQRQYPCRLVLPLGWATAPVRYPGAVAGPSPAWLYCAISQYCNTLAYDIMIQFFPTIQALDMSSVGWKKLTDLAALTSDGSKMKSRWRSVADFTRYWLEVNFELPVIITTCIQPAH